MLLLNMHEYYKYELMWFCAIGSLSQVIWVLGIPRRCKNQSSAQEL